MSTNDAYELIGGILYHTPVDETSSFIDSADFRQAKRIADGLLSTYKTKRLVRIIAKLDERIVNYMNSQVVDFLYEYYQCPNDWVYLAVKHNMPAVMTYLYSMGINRFEYTKALRAAAEQGCLKILKFLHNNGVELHGGQSNAFQLALLNKRLDVVKYLVENGSNVNVEFAEKYTYKTPLEIAIYKRDGAMIRFLLERGAVITDNYIEFVITYGGLELVKCLMESNVKIHKHHFERQWPAPSDVLNYLRELVKD